MFRIAQVIIESTLLASFRPPTSQREIWSQHLHRQTLSLRPDQHLNRATHTALWLKTRAGPPA